MGGAGLMGVDAGVQPDVGRHAVSVTLATEADRGAWDAYVGTHQREAAAPPGAEGPLPACGYHEWAWRGVFERTFGHAAFGLIARAGQAIVGVLPLVEIRSPLFGRTLTSMPFVNYGGVAADSPDAARALFEAAAVLARQRACRHVELRHVERAFSDRPCRRHKVAMWLPLQAGMWERIDRKARNQVRKAEKSGLTFERGGAELVGDFYAVFARNMRDLGTPVYTRRLFDEVLAAFSDRARVLVVRLGDQPVAAGLTYRTGRTIEMPWASSIRDHNPLCPNHLLYWRAIEAAVADGCERFDFGRSTPGEGTFKFKEQWGAAPVWLHWEYWLASGVEPPDQSPKNPKFQLAIRTWQRLPLWITNRIGPAIVRNIP